MIIRTAWGVILAGLSAAAVLTIAYQFDPQRSAQQAAEKVASIASAPYAVIAIVPDSLREVIVREQRDHDAGTWRWILQYRLLVSEKHVECRSLTVHRSLYRQGDAVAVADNTVPSPPMIGMDEAPRTVNQEMLLSGKLEPGTYLLTVEITCFQLSPDTGIPVASAPPAKAVPLCFQVPVSPDAAEVLELVHEACASQAAWAAPTVRLLRTSGP